MEHIGHFSLTILLVLVGVQSLARFASCRPSQKMTYHTIGQKDLINQDIKNGKMKVSHRRKMKLFSPKSKGYLQIMENAVNAQGTMNSTYADLVIESVGFGLIRIKGQNSSSYICFNPRTSRLVPRKNGADTNCIFREAIGEKTKRTIFTSWQHESWHIGIKNNGLTRLGARHNKTASIHNNTSIQFTMKRKKNKKKQTKEERQKKKEERRKQRKKQKNKTKEGNIKIKKTK